MRKLEEKKVENVEKREGKSEKNRVKVIGREEVEKWNKKAERISKKRFDEPKEMEKEVKKT